MPLRSLSTCKIFSDKRNPDNLPRETIRKWLTLQNPEEQNEEEKNERKKDEILIQVVLRCR